MTTLTARYGLVKIVEATDNVDVVGQFDNNWDAIDLKLGSQVCTFSTLPASPPQGMTAIATDVKGFFVNEGTSGSPSWLNLNVNSDWFNVVTQYGADPTGVADSTTAINNALAACNAVGGGVVYFPPGTYKCTPSGSPAVALKLNNGTNGYIGVRMVGAGKNTTTLKKNGVGTLLQTGATTSPGSGSTHARYCSLENIGVNGNNQTGALVDCYYVDNMIFSEVYFNNNADIIIDCAEFWDSRFYNVIFGGSGSTTASTLAPNCYIRNSSSATGYGNSTDTTNVIIFHGCRWEAFLTGAVRITQGTGGTGGPSNIYFTDCKMETSQLNGGNHVYVDNNSRSVFISHLYLYSGGFYTGFSTAQDMVNFGPQMGTMSDVLLSSGTPATVANGITVTSPNATDSVALENISATWTTAPTGALINFSTMTGFVSYTNVSATSGALYAGNAPKQPGLTAVTGTTTIANTTATTNLQASSIRANEPFTGSVYSMKGYGQFSTTGTVTLAFSAFWNSTLLAHLALITDSAGLTGLPYEYEILLNFYSATSVASSIRLSWAPSTANDSTDTYCTSLAATAVTTSSANTLAMAFAWGTASASNTITAYGGCTVKVV